MRTIVNLLLIVLLGTGVPAIAMQAQSSAYVSWGKPIELATGPAIRGPWKQNESRYDYVDDAAVALNEQSHAAIAWVDQGRKDVLFQRVSPDGKKLLAQPVNISRSPAIFSWLPRVAFAPDAEQTVYALWQEIIFSGGSHGGEMLFARSEDGGATFTAPINLSNSIAGDGKGRINKDFWHNGSYDLVTAEDGTIYIAWTEYEGALWFSRSKDQGRNFSEPKRMNANANMYPARGPALASGKDGTVYLAWTVGGADDADIHLAKSTNGGQTFTQPRIISQTEGYSDAPAITVSPDGMLHLVYAESNGGPFDRYKIRYTRSSDGARTFDAPRIISAPSIDQTTAGFPYIDSDGRGNLFAMWELFPQGWQRPRGLGMAVSTNQGQSFAAPVIVPGSRDPRGGINGSVQGLFGQKLDVNNAGAIAVVNSSIENGVRSRVWMVPGVRTNTTSQ